MMCVVGNPCCRALSAAVAGCCQLADTEVAIRQSQQGFGQRFLGYIAQDRKDGVRKWCVAGGREQATFHERCEARVVLFEGLHQRTSVCLRPVRLLVLLKPPLLSDGRGGMNAEENLLLPSEMQEGWGLLAVDPANQGETSSLSYGSGFAAQYQRQQPGSSVPWPDVCALIDMAEEALAAKSQKIEVSADLLTCYERPQPHLHPARPEREPTSCNGRVRCPAQELTSHESLVNADSGFLQEQVQSLLSDNASMKERISLLER